MIFHGIVIGNMSTKSRTFNIARNAVVSLVCQLITIFLGFACRKALILSLGLAYNGANSLFSSIINLLSFVELGIGNAVIYNLYKPLAERNNSLIAEFIHYYKKVYTIIALSVFMIGCIMVPSLKLFVTVEDGIRENVYWMYILTLIATSCTYLFAAEKTLLIADQKQYIERTIYQITHICQVISQIVVLFVFKSYYMFLIIQIIFTLLCNVISAVFVNKHYNYIKGKCTSLSKKNRKNLFRDVKATMFYKVGTSCLNCIDSLFVSYLCGLVVLGKIANYTLILTTLSGLISQFTNAMSASIGNKSVLDSKEDITESFFDSLFLVVWISGFFFVSYLLLVNPFVSIVFGKDCVLAVEIVFSMGLLYFVSQVHSISATYRYAIGVFQQGRYAPLVASVLNIVLSYVLYKLIGVPGLYISTIIARVLTLGIVDAYYIIGGFAGVYIYFKKIFVYFTAIMALYCTLRSICGLWSIDSVFKWGITAICIGVVYNLLWLVLFSKTKNGKKTLLYGKTIMMRKSI